MAEELGKIEKPSVGDFKKGRRLYFVPLVFPGIEAPQEYQEKCNKYWEQVESQLTELELKLGSVRRIFHELVAESGENALKTLEKLNEKSYQAVKYRVAAGSEVEATEDPEILAEFLDWGRCLSIGIQSQNVFKHIYEAYVEAGKKRNEHITRMIDDSLKSEEICILFMREGHQVQFPRDIEIFYVAPPALDELKKWLREIESKQPETDIPEETPENK